MKVVPAPSERCTTVIGWLPITLPPLSVVIDGSFQLTMSPCMMPHSELRERRTPDGGIVRFDALKAMEMPLTSRGVCTSGPRFRLYPSGMLSELL